MKLIPSKATIKSVAKYILLGGAIFAIGLIWNFPYERIRDTITGALTRSTGYQIDMDRLSPALPMGFEAEKARVLLGPGGANGGDAITRVLLLKAFGQPNSDEIDVDSLRVTVNPFSLLAYVFTKSLSVSYAAQQGSTRWKGGLTFGKDSSGASVGTRDWKVAWTLPGEQISPDLAGGTASFAAKVTFSADVEGKTPALQAGDLSGAQGKASLLAANVDLKIPGLEPIRCDKIQGEGQLEKGKLTVKSFAVSGPDVNGTANGIINVPSFFPRSQVDLEVKVTLSKRLKDLVQARLMMSNPAGIRINDEGTTAFKVSGSFDSSIPWNVRGY
ncbi:MAG: type II secretion system protein GspN [Pseudomonadota bacterium]